MHTITTKYSNRKITAKCWNGSVRIEADDALRSEQNHRAAAEKLIAKLNKDKDVKFGIKLSAPSADDGWTFIIDYVGQNAPSHMSITVRFMSATNTGPAYMKAHSWLRPNGIKVNYSHKVADGSDIQANARYAAEIMLETINADCASHNVKWVLKDYVETYNGDRLFTLQYA